MYKNLCFCDFLIRSRQGCQIHTIGREQFEFIPSVELGLTTLDLQPISRDSPDNIGVLKKTTIEITYC